MLNSRPRLFLALVLALTGITDAPAVPSCRDAPQGSPCQPKLVSKPGILLPDSLSPEQQGRYRARVQELGTAPLYHDIVRHPRATLDTAAIPKVGKGFSVDGPIFLVALEKPTRNAPAHVGEQCADAFGHGFTIARVRDAADPLRERVRKTMCDVLQDGRPQLLTHVVRIDGVRENRYGDAAFLYNIYDMPVEASGKKQRDESLYSGGLQALAALRAALHAALASGGYTDVVVLSTGWNTAQRETLYNAQDWMNSIDHARRSEPRPYRAVYIVTSWQSKWDNAFLKALSLDVITKGNDADEIGLTWANRLVQDVVVPEAGEAKLPVTLVGHSYGTRILGSALYVRDIIDRPVPSNWPPIAFVALQPAFPVNRYGTDPGAGKEPWFAGVDPRALVVLTSSKYDTATSLLPFGRYVGGGGAPARVRKNVRGNLDAFAGEVLVARSCGVLPDPSKLVRSRPHLIDANGFISCRMPGTGGGAHSDVYDAAAGRLIAQAMDAAVLPLSEVSNACPVH